MVRTDRDEQAQGRDEAGVADVSMLPERHERPALESAFVRVIATSGVVGIGVVGIGVALGAILTLTKGSRLDRRPGGRARRGDPQRHPVVLAKTMSRPAHRRRRGTDPTCASTTLPELQV